MDWCKVMGRWGQAAFRAALMPLGSSTEEIRQQLVALLGQNTFRVKLNPFNRQALVADPHNFIRLTVFFRPGRDFEAIWQGVSFDHQRMIAGDREWVIQASKHAAVSMNDGRRLAVHDLTGADNIATVYLSDRLMAKAHPEDG